MCCFSENSTFLARADTHKILLQGKLDSENHPKTTLLPS
ncbi:hypothetical protein C943_02362 [Mariniradius saccharolyticus AK6]|uniref:Uncharacterized protein n=1 Tax=Mariniradius saccharolyticus AK6 TaxID=1239962 RepID=M7X111_9BACT|nr:hypothetical protein C943_02362 [Mariniradius saccharolyticus AK6]